jgi:ABC-type transport system substrate-binding protein
MNRNFLIQLSYYSSFLTLSCFWFVLIAFVSPNVFGENMKILLNVGKENPYSEVSPAATLAAFNATVLGQLLKTDEYFELHMGLLKEARYDFKKSCYILTLREGVQFHNGRIADAKDLEFSLTRGFFTKHRSFYSIFLGNIEGVESIKDSNHFKSGALSGVKITGPLTVEVKLKQPNPSFLHSLINPYFSLVPKEEMNEDLITWRTFPIGAGPYRVIAPGFKDGKVYLKKFYAGLNDAPDEVMLSTVLDESAYDISLVPFKGMENRNYSIFFSTHPQYISALYFSNVHPLGHKIEFRQFIQRAINRAPLAEKIMGSEATYELLPKHFWGRAHMSDPYSTSKAKELFEKLPSELVEKEWKVPVFGGKELSEDRKAIAEYVRQSLSEFGLKIHPYPSPEKFISEKTALESPLFISGRVSDLIDPLILYAAMRNGGAYKYECPHKDPYFEELYLKAASAMQKEERTQTVQALSQYTNDKAYIVPLLERKAVIYYDSNKIESVGEQDQPINFFVDRIKLKKRK